MGKWIIGLREVEASQLNLVGGKGLQLGMLAKQADIRVPHGICVTTEAYRAAIEQNEPLQALLDELDGLTLEDRDAIGKVSERIRECLLQLVVPPDVVQAFVQALAHLNGTNAWAVRSSATAEDLPHASFAGQHDSFLNVIGEDVLDRIKQCWASLYTDRAVLYRMHNGIKHRDVHMAVIVQQMVPAEYSGVMFTADPVTGHRSKVVIDAGTGLGEDYVSGKVAADHYELKDETLIVKKETVSHDAQLLTDSQIRQLAGIGKHIEKEFGHPQDIEWCLADGQFHIVQSRPITTLFPVPEANDGQFHVYVSVGHQQMMTDAMKPLGLSFYLLTTPAPMCTAGGRLFVDVVPMLATPQGRMGLLQSLGQSDPLIKDALVTVMERQNMDIPEIPANALPPMTEAPDPAAVTEWIKQSEEAIEELERAIRSKSGEALFSFIREDIGRLTERLTGPQTLALIMVSMNAARWINVNMKEWLDEGNAADVLAQSVPNNVTSEMGLALLDVADALRSSPEAMASLQRGDWEAIQGEARQAIDGFLDKYGMRCSGEIDITRPRWREQPKSLIPLIINNINRFEPGESKHRFERGLREARVQEEALLARLQALPDGESKAADTKRMIDELRAFSGFREYPKYEMIQRYFIYKQALLQEADRLVQAGVLRHRDDVFHLTFDELEETVRTRRVDEALIQKRKQEYSHFQTLMPPRVMTSDGEIIAGRYRRDSLPPGAMAGLAVSAGVVEGRARVLFDMEGAVLEEGDILVTVFTDPSWTPLFVSIKGLVTEVGGLMTHGAVIAREYGLPAVVGVEGATRMIKDGQRIRVNGTDGTVEVLE